MCSFFLHPWTSGNKSLKTYDSLTYDKKKKNVLVVSQIVVDTYFCSFKSNNCDRIVRCKRDVKVYILQIFFFSATKKRKLKKGNCDFIMTNCELTISWNCEICEEIKLELWG